MFGLGFGEMVVIAILAIVVVGPSRLPTLMKTVGGAMRQLRQASRDIRSSVGFDELIDLNEPPTQRPVARARPAQAPHATSENAPVAHGTVAHGTVTGDTPTTAGSTPADSGSRNPGDGTPTSGA